MIDKPLLADRNLVGLMILLLTEGEISSMRMAEVNSYDYVKKAALRLEKAGLIESERTGPRDKVVWRLTERGRLVAKQIYVCEKCLTAELLPEKYYKQ